MHERKRDVLGEIGWSEVAEVWEGRERGWLARVVADYQTRDYHNGIVRVKNNYKWFVWWGLASEFEIGLRKKSKPACFAKTAKPAALPF